MLFHLLAHTARGCVYVDIIDHDEIIEIHFPLNFCNPALYDSCSARGRVSNEYTGYMSTHQLGKEYSPSQLGYQ